MQVVIDSQPKDGASIDIFGALPQQVSGSWVDPHVVDGTKSGKDPDTARHQYSKSESMSDKESKIQRLKEFMSNTSSRKIGFGSATTQMTYTERSDLSNTGHTDRSARCSKLPKLSIGNHLVPCHHFVNLFVESL